MTPATIAGVLTAPPPTPGVPLEHVPAAREDPGRQAQAPAATAGPGGAGAAAHTPAYLIKVTALEDGTFTVTNTRNGFSKTYRPRR